ncbi:Glycosyl transferase family 2 [Nitrosotalea devaniterrae]|uniref:Glycosyl transferase family 2 n=1 Tax=Nitrosotalea devaniterrae TaxID=1078905 RepID=A0A128A262_9ARCH|nr:Glycosyl transferase family 2 [Candidatus Nitrosotalea devanaterra]
MYIILDAINYFLAAIMLSVSVAWMFLVKSMWITFRDSPFLDKYNSRPHHTPKVSIILPARNEEMFIEKCINSLLEQDYKNYEIIAIDDMSDDNTGEIIKKIAKKNSKVIHVTAGPKPEKWIGKNWACIEGFKRSSGELLLFTDADTTHTRKTISLSVDHLLSEELDSLTVIPKMLCLDWWTKITLPVLSTFLHTRFSALRVNDPSKKTGYFFGSFFIIKRKTYEAVGTHESVKSEIVEDGALGKKVKEQGFKLKMVRGEHLVEAVWARDLTTLWHALKRLMIPLYIQSSKMAVGIFFAVLFLLFMPFPIIIYSISFVNMSTSFVILLGASLFASGMFYLGSAIDAKKGLSLGFRHVLFAPLGSTVIVSGFASGILHAKKSNAVTWRGRTYSISDTKQNAISL